MRRSTKVLVLASLFVVSSLSARVSDMTTKATPELLKELDELEIQHMNAPTTQEKDAINEKQLRVYQELVRRGEIF